MKTLYCIFPLLLVWASVHAQSGCTDPQATNYNASATINNGSCIYAPSFQVTYGLGSLMPLVTESSGLTLSDGFLWTHNDRGGQPQIYKVDTSNGNILQTVTISNFFDVDWEDITTDSNYFYIGDFGNNDGNRIDLKVLKVAKSQFISNTAATVSVTAEAISFSYSDQTSFTTNSINNFDCESIIAVKDSLYLFTKDRGDLQTRVYKLSKVPGSYSISPYTSFNVSGLITGADYDQQRKKVVLIGYLSSKLNSFLYYLSDFQNDQFFLGNKRRVEIGNSSNDWQTEGVAFNAAGDLFLSCETSYVPATLYKSARTSIFPLSISLQKETYDVQVYPNPASDQVIISSAERIVRVELIAGDGRLVLCKEVNSQSCTLNTSQLSATAACYILKIVTDKAVISRKLNVIK